MCLPYQVGDTTAPFVRGRWPERVGIPALKTKTGEPRGSPSGPPRARAGHVPAALLREYDFIVREQGSGTRAALEKFLADEHVELRVIMEMASNETIKQAVMAGMGLSCKRAAIPPLKGSV